MKIIFRFIALVLFVFVPCELEGQPVTEDQKLIPSGLLEDSLFGASVAIDGTTAVIGAFADEGVAFESGAAYVYEYVDGEWQLLQKLVSPEFPPETGFQFGRSVDIFGDRIVIGAPTGNSAVYVFRKFGLTWFPESVLRPSGSSGGDSFGSSVAITTNLIAAGAPNDSTDGSQSGVAYIFSHSTGAGWSQEARLDPSGVRTGDGLGSSIVIIDQKWSGTGGHLVVVGAPRDDAPNFDSGSASVYRRDGGNWDYVTQFTHPDPVGDRRFATAMSTSQDLLVVGAPKDAGSGGSAVIYRISESGLIFESTLNDPDPREGTFFAGNLSLMNSRVAIGSVEVDTDDTGSVRLYEYLDGEWTFIAELNASDGMIDDAFGRGLTVTNSGVLIGAPDSDPVSLNSGSAYWFAIARTCLPDVNADGLLEPDDVDAWINAFMNDLPACDQNGDGSCTFTDFIAWIANFNAGC